jgi:hypothetical protein
VAREHEREHGFSGNWQCGRTDGGHAGGYGRNAADGRVRAGDTGGGAGCEHVDADGEQRAAGPSDGVGFDSERGEPGGGGIADLHQRLAGIQLQQYDICDVGRADERAELAVCSELLRGEHGAGADGGDYDARHAGSRIRRWCRRRWRR